MYLELIIAILLTLAPVIELRGGLPLAIFAAQKYNLSVYPIAFLIILLNVLLIFAIFFFLDFLHFRFLKFKWYRKVFESYLKKLQRKTDKVEKKMGVWGFLALTLFVAIPLPGTGAYTGTIIAWVLELERKKSIIAIGAGVIIAGVLVLLGTLGILKLF